MRLTGGYNLHLEGRPTADLDTLPSPGVLWLPLESRRFRFSRLHVQDGECVRAGQTVASDPAHYDLPLLAPRDGHARLHAAPGHVALELTGAALESSPGPDCASGHASDAAAKRRALVTLGAWEFFSDAHTGALPDPFGEPRAILISALQLDTFEARGDVLLHADTDSFLGGLRHLQSLLEYQSIYLVLPEVQSRLAAAIREAVQGFAWVKTLLVPKVYPNGDPALIARRLGLMGQAERSVWATGVAGVQATDCALSRGRPCLDRVVSVGGPAACRPRHLRAMVGYPLDQLLTTEGTGEPVRIIDGGVLSGSAVPASCKGLNSECTGLTLIRENCEREFLGFMRPGFDRRSRAARCFLGSLRPSGFCEASNTALRGERRPCVACGQCAGVCPARILPYAVHRFLYRNQLEEAERLRIDLCIECGLCSYICPSKIDLRQEFVEGKAAIQEELHATQEPAE